MNFPKLPDGDFVAIGKSTTGLIFYVCVVSSCKLFGQEGKSSMTNPVWLAVAAMFFYGAGGPLMKMSHQAGISTRDFVFISGSVTVLLATFWANGESVMFSGKTPGAQALWTTIAAGIMLSLGFINLNRALAEPLGLVSVVMIIASANPLISSSLSMVFLNEAKKMNLSTFIPGALLIVVGTILVGLSTKFRF